jgi:thiol-disulfide isomerase/thioredoxin
MKGLLLGLVVTLALFSGNVWAQCEAPLEIRQSLSRPVLRRQALVESRAQKDAREAAFKEALAKYPDNYNLLAMQLSGFIDRDEKLNWAREQRKQHPDRPVYAAIEAMALMGTDTPKSIQSLEKLRAAHPELRLNIPLAGIWSSGRFRDADKVRKELDSYIRSCGESIAIGGSFPSLVQQNGTPEQIAWTAATMRKRLETEAAEINPNAWQNLWQLEFKQHPPAEHEAVRKQIREDLSRLEKSPQPQELPWMKLLISGYESVGDKAAVERLNNEIVSKHPESNEAKSVYRKQWSEKHPMPKMDDKPAVETYARDVIAAAKDRLNKWPGDSASLDTILSSLTKLPETTAGQVAAAADELLTAYRKPDRQWQSTPPVHFRIAEAYIQYKIRLDQVADLVNEGYQESLTFNRLNSTDDRIDEQTRTMLLNSMDYLHLQGARILLDCYAATKQAQKAKEVVEELASMNSAKAPTNYDWEVLGLKAQAAEIDGRKLDALMLYRSAIDERGPYKGIGEDSLAQNAERLWKELGGTQEGIGAGPQKKKLAESTEGRWERSKSSLPAFSLSDINGKTWSMAKLMGKAAVINVWATWCGPCIAEHPEFQKLYDKLKNRTDVAVLSFSIDEDIGKVAPYMAKHRYTFPVLPALDLVSSVKSNLAVPQIWLVTPQGKLGWEQIGYSTEDTKWQETVLLKLEELLKKP